MVDVPLRHHVYSSIRGYRTLYCSPEIPGETARLLDALAQRLQRASGGGAIEGFFDLVGGLACAVRGVPFGADHVGRPRVCIHSVVVADADLARVPFFTPTAFPSGLFADEGMDLQYIANELAGSWRAGDAAAGGAAARLAGLPDAGWVRLFLPILLAENLKTCFVDGEVARQVLDAVAVLLPPSRRRRLSFLRVAKPPDGDLPTPCHLYLVDQMTEESEADPDLTVADLRTGATRNLPPLGRYARFLLDGLAGAGGGGRGVAPLCGLLERHCAEVEFNEYRLAQLLDGYIRLRSALDGDGNLQRTVDPLTAAQAAVAFARAGCGRLGSALIRTASRTLAGEDAVLQRRIDELERGRLTGAALEKAVEELAGELVPHEGRDPLNDTTFLG